MLPAKFDSRRQLEYNVQPDWSNQIITIYLIGQLKPVKCYDIIFLREMISYNFTGITFIHGFITLISTQYVIKDDPIVTQAT